MAYSVPYGWERAATPNHIIGATTVLILPPPGVGNRYRILAMDVSIVRSTTGIVDENWAPTLGTPIIWTADGLSIGGTPGRSIILPEPGIILQDNEGLNLTATSSAATGTTVGIVWYVMDVVT